MGRCARSWSSAPRPWARGTCALSARCRQATVNPYYGALDVRAFPSRPNEALPLVLAEACAMALPVVAYCSNAVTDFFAGQPDTGTLVPQQDVTALAQAIVRLFGDTPWRQRQAEQNRHLAQTYSIETAADRYVTLLEEVRGRRGPRAPVTISAGLLRHLANIVMLLGDKPRAERFFNRAYAQAPELGPAMQEDVREFVAFVQKLQQAQRNQG